ncbi:hypothetical protein JCM15519_00390 [Fundidesulfovibrio butyratiphilus]
METLRTLPGDDVRQIMWRYADRYDLQMAIQSARSLARTLVARLVAEGARHTHEWTDHKAQLLKAFDETGLTALFMDIHQGGFIDGPKNLALTLVAFEIAWVDAGAATCSLATNLALAPIHERGTTEQRDHYMSRCVPPHDGEDRQLLRGAFALTEPLPYVGVETTTLQGKVKIAEWVDGQEPVLQVDKRGRFITGMDFANFATVAVDTADPRIKSSCMIIIEESDPGLFDRGAPTMKMVHQLSSTRDPVFSLQVPASRIIGGYTVKDGVIVPNYTHTEIIAAVFSRTRVPVALMSTAKLLSSIEPVIRYHRQRFRGGEATEPGTPKYDLGIQQKPDSVLRLADIWAMAEAGASLGMEAARIFDALDPCEKTKDKLFAEQGVSGLKAQMVALRKVEKRAIDYLALKSKPEGERDQAQLDALEADPLVQYVLFESQADVLCPACKLWNTGQGANMMREVLALMGGYGITEDCPGFLFNKWTDAQLEATYEGPEVVQRRQLSIAMPNAVFKTWMRIWITDLEALAKDRPNMGAATTAKTLDLWLWTLDFLLRAKDPSGAKLYHNRRQSVTFPMADALCWGLASRLQIADVVELIEKGPENPIVAEGLEGTANFFSDLCMVQAAKAAGEVGRLCASMVYGFGPQAEEDLAAFEAKRAELDRSLFGAALAKDRAGQGLTQVMIPEALDYPL